MYLSDELIMEKLNSLHEHKMAKDIFVKLLKKKGLKGVRFVGGRDENGIDIEYYEESNADGTRQYAGIQFKKGDITYSAKGGKGTVVSIKNQAEEAFVKDIFDSNGNAYHISRFIVAATGEINDSARKMINKAKNRGEQTNITYWDFEKLSEDIREYHLEEFIEYFNLSENDENDDFGDDDEYVITDDYIENNYRELVNEARKCVKMFSFSQRKIIKAVTDNYFKSNSQIIFIGDLLYEIGRTQEDVRDDIIELQNLESIEFDERHISLKGRANSLIELAGCIIDEMVPIDEYDPERAEEIFYGLVNEL